MSGVKIDQVKKGSVAYNCGMRTGDFVLEVANVKITHPLEFFSVLSEQKNNSHAEIKVLRDEKELLCVMHLKK